MKPDQPAPVKYFCGILYSDPQLVERAIAELESLLGFIDYRSAALPFDISDYYEPEMGAGIQRLFVSFEQLRDPGELAAMKIATNALEDRLAMEGQRKVNIDTGYLDYDKLVLASAKYNGQKIYLSQGIYADPTLHFRKGTFEPYSTAFPDFKDDRYYGFLLEIRRLYKLGMMP
jgi:hypothetical protein